FTMSTGQQTGHKYIGNTFSVNDDLSHIRGNHQMAFGVSAMRGQMSTFAIFASVNRIAFNGATTGLGLADFLVGKMSSFQSGQNNAHHQNGFQIAVYATDTWKMRPRLTLNYGIRWEPFIAPNAESIFNFDYERFRQGIKSSVFLNAP